MDACPGRLNQVALYIKRPGTYYGQCSEICGVQHAFMPIVVEALEYRDWLDKFFSFSNELKKNNPVKLAVEIPLKTYTEFSNFDYFKSIWQAIILEPKFDKLIKVDPSGSIIREGRVIDYIIYEEAPSMLDTPGGKITVTIIGFLIGYVAGQPYYDDDF
jgi:hypothetical protein